MKPYLNFSALPAVRGVLFVCALAISGISLLQGCVPLIFAGVGAGALMAADRRSMSAYVDDEAIELRVGNLIRKYFGNINHVNVTSYNRNVLLTGEVQDAAAQAEIQRLAGTVSNVRNVINETVIAPPSSLSNRANDSMISTNVKTRLLAPESGVAAHHVKVITEANVVFLLGLVTESEGESAAETARGSKGVTKVVKVFEYIGNSSAAENPAIDRGQPPPPPPEAP
ncbi:MAG: BON domain-containing protein [Azoarcus sp.]|jgi:osmotically-inducible protein OsmY|nr:BON domain-containing protein [Azoarcus sp.]